MSTGKDTYNSFFLLLRSGLWEKECQLSSYKAVDYREVLRTAQEQSVVGLIAAGLEHVVDATAPKDVVLSLVGEALQIEQRNTAMNSFISATVENMHGAGIYPILGKGQGIAQCYERPIWRASGDIDFFLSEKDYNKAVAFMKPLASEIEEENSYYKHIAMSIESWEVELHGTMRGGLWKRHDDAIDRVYEEIFYNGCTRQWMNGDVAITLPGENEDVFYVFTHILQHFYKGGVGLRQICDWVRLLWHYRTDIDSRLLEQRLRFAGIMSEWRVFAALAVDTLGMPAEAMTLYDPSGNWYRKADKVLAFVLETGNFGHNRDVSYYEKYPYLVYKTISLSRNTWDSMRHFVIFPLDATKVWWNRLEEGVKTVMKGK